MGDYCSYGSGPATRTVCILMKYDNRKLEEDFISVKIGICRKETSQLLNRMEEAGIVETEKRNDRLYAWLKPEDLSKNYNPACA